MVDIDDRYLNCLCYVMAHGFTKLGLVDRGTTSSGPEPRDGVDDHEYGYPWDQRWINM